MLGKFRGNIVLKFVFSVVSSRCLYVHACFFFLYLSFSLSFVSPLHTSFTLSLSILFTYICMHTRLFSRAHNGIQHARARVTENTSTDNTHLHRKHMPSPYHAFKRAHTHASYYTYILSFSFFLFYFLLVLSFVGL